MTRSVAQMHFRRQLLRVISLQHKNELSIRPPLLCLT
jgi:hypothetical protein